ncbi:Golga7 [Columba guinea]|nr:Golga7 [Columba guinea]
MRPQQAPVSGKVFIQRDYSGGTRCQFQSKFPAELENRIDRQQFEETVRTLNNLYAEAEKLGGQSYLEGCLACLTAYTIFLCMETHYEKVLKKIAKFIQEQNEKIYAPQGLLLTDPIERGLRVVSFGGFLGGRRRSVRQQWTCRIKVPLPPPSEHHSFLCRQIRSAMYYTD